MTDSVTDSYLDDLIRLAEASTPKPWEWSTSNSYRRLSSETHDGDVLRAIAQRHDGQLDIDGSDNDKKYIVAACNALPVLVKRIQELEDQCGICGGPGPREPSHPYCTLCAQALASPFVNLDRLHMALRPLEKEIYEAGETDTHWEKVANALRALASSSK